jgi:hypothetical protein
VVSGPGLVQVAGQAVSEKSLVGSTVELRLRASFRTSDDHEVVLTSKLLHAELQPAAGGATAVWKVEGSRSLRDLPDW